MGEVVNISYLGDFLSLGGLGFVFGVALPFGFRLVGYITDGVLKFIR